MGLVRLGLADVMSSTVVRYIVVVTVCPWKNLFSKCDRRV